MAKIRISGNEKSKCGQTYCNANAMVDAHLKYYLRLMPQLKA